MIRCFLHLSVHMCIKTISLDKVKSQVMGLHMGCNRRDDDGGRLKIEPDSHHICMLTLSVSCTLQLVSLLNAYPDFLQLFCGLKVAHTHFKHENTQTNTHTHAVTISCSPSNHVLFHCFNLPALPFPSSLLILIGQ